MKSIKQLYDMYQETGRPYLMRGCEVVGILAKEW